ncbi:MAG: bifunctional metallophosphatase/5'-nucleotidase [Anaerolineae bacterium]|nr:bifunctional metallophosphatase/5'-nucleotidase [Anaerolineae bacterium]
MKLRRLSILIPTALLLSACIFSPGETTPLPAHLRQVTIFFTADEHGYLEPLEDGNTTIGGAAGLMAHLVAEGYEPHSDSALLLSGGDMWTGPAVSSWFQGLSAVTVFNAMSYDAAALGNHDFDFGQPVLAANAAEAEFPFLAANLTETESGATPDFAQPYTIRQVNGVQVGIVGLSLQSTPQIVVPDYVAGLDFGDYETALREAVPQARAAGAELVVVIAHVCPNDLSAIAATAAELEIPLLAGGHCHQLTITERRGVLVVGAGSHWDHLIRVDLLYDQETGAVVEQEARAVSNLYRTAEGSPVTPDPTIAALVAEWTAQTDELLGEVIGYTTTGIEVDWPLYNLVTDSWLWAYPEGNLAISNPGGFREIIPPGEITLADIVAVMPFDNSLIDVELTGAEVLENLRCCGGVVAGMTVRSGPAGIAVTLRDGSSLDPQATYHVLVNSYIYQGGDGYLFGTQDPDAYDTGIHWRDPVIEWLRIQGTSPEQPLEELLDDTARN